MGFHLSQVKVSYLLMASVLMSSIVSMMDKIKGEID